MAKEIDISGQTFARLTVVGRADVLTKDGRVPWTCNCVCGNAALVLGKHLRSGNTKSCGCLKIESFRRVISTDEHRAKLLLGNVTHGHRRRNQTPEYSTWLRIKSRCNNPGTKDYAWYGARGIRVCDEWSSSFETFLSDMGIKPTRNHTIDRLDPTKHYSKDNCRWATAFEQLSENRTDLRRIEVFGLSFPSLSAACRHFRVGFSTAHNRIEKGVPIEQVFARERILPRRPDQSVEFSSRAVVKRN